MFYEVLVRAFYDGSADGAGDLCGLIEKLDYLKWLGVDCLWLPPFDDSPVMNHTIFQILAQTPPIPDMFCWFELRRSRVRG